MMKKLTFNRTIYVNLLILVVFLTYLYFPLFLHAGSLAVELWDESLFGLRALHIYEHGSYMINFDQFEGMHEHMNTKLPFTTFFQVLGIHLMGVNELAIQLPMTLIFLATVLFLVYYFKKQTGSLFVGIAFGVTLVSAQVLIGQHMLRTGNQDVPFACYIVLSLVFFHRFIEESKNKHLAWFTFFFIAALLTKNLLVGLIVPGIVVYLLYKKLFVKLLKSQKIYFSIAIILVSYFGVIFYYEWSYPGFIDRMWGYELLGRYTKTIEQHEGGLFFYFNAFLQSGFSPYGYFTILAMLLMVDKKMNASTKGLILLLTCVFFSYLLGISFSQTKTFWYITPLYPISALIIGLSFFHLYKTYILPQKRVAQFGFIGILIACSSHTYSDVIRSVYKPTPKFKEHFYGQFLKKIKKENKQKASITSIDYGFGASMVFTNAVYNHEGSLNVSHQHHIQLAPGDTVVTCDTIVLNNIRSRYNYQTLMQDSCCFMIMVEN